MAELLLQTIRNTEVLPAEEEKLRCARGFKGPEFDDRGARESVRLLGVILEADRSRLSRCACSQRAVLLRNRARAERARMVLVSVSMPVCGPGRVSCQSLMATAT